MAQIKVLDLDNAFSLSELSCKDMNIVKGGNIILRRYEPLFRFLPNKKLWWVASLSTPA